VLLMASNYHLHPGQMKLFMTGTELKESITGSIDRAPMQSMDDMWKRKLRESKGEAWHGGGTHASLKEHGWVGPGPGIHQRMQPGAIPEWNKEHLQVEDAHHRIAAAADIEKRSKGKRTIWIPTTNRSDVFIEARDIKPPKLDPDAM
jgi:hypothetical protein